MFMVMLIMVVMIMVVMMMIMIMIMFMVFSGSFSIYNALNPEKMTEKYGIISQAGTKRSDNHLPDHHVLTSKMRNEV